MIATTHKKALAKKALAVVVILIFGLTAEEALASILYQDLPTSLTSPPNISFHNAVGPVISDDFILVFGSPHGDLFRAHTLTYTWWGSQPTSNLWELVLQENNPALGEPALTPPERGFGEVNTLTGGIKAFVSANGVPTAIPGIFEFSAKKPAFDPGFFGDPFALFAGTPYWLTVANANSGWNWALALDGPDIGSEMFNAHRSVGGVPFSQGGNSCNDGGPHCGPWTDIHTDFAFRIAVVSEPPILAVLAAGLALVRFFYRCRTSV